MASLYTFEKKARRERPRPRLPASVRVMPHARRISVALLALLMALGGAACLFDSEESPTTTEQITTTAPPRTTTTAATTMSATTTTEQITTTAPPRTTTTAATTAVITFPPEVVTNYLKTVLTSEVGIGELAEEIVTISNNWDNRSETDVTYSDTEAAMEAVVERTQAARADFELIQPPPTKGFPEEHRTVRAAVGQVAEAAAEMLAGLQSPDTGEQRRAAQAGLAAAFGVFTEAINRVIAEFIGDEDITALIVSRSLTVPAPAGWNATTTEPDTTPTTEAG